jgi:hypothetical protein
VRRTVVAALCCATGLATLAPVIAACDATAAPSPAVSSASCAPGNPYADAYDPDFNGDGHTDYVIGMPDANDGQGGLEVVLGDDKPIVLLPGTGGIPAVPAGSHFGASTAAISVTGASCDDLLVGIPDLTVGGVSEAGGIQMLIGTPSGFTVGPVITAGTGGAPGVPEPDAHFGTSIAGGHGGKVTVGVPGATVMGGADGLTPLAQAGEVVNFAITATGAVALTGQSIQTMATGAQAGAHYGTLATDMFATAPDASHGATPDTGYVEIQRKGFFGPAAGDRLGVSMAEAPAEYDADHITALFVGAPGSRVAGHDQAGAVEHFDFGSDSTTYQQYVATITQATKGVPGSPTTGAQFGASIASGSAGADTAEVVIGAPGKDVGGATGAGALYFERLAETGHTAGDLPQGWSSITQATRGVAGVPRKDAAFGDALASIADGIASNTVPHFFIVGIPGAHPAGDPASGAVETFPLGTGLKAAGAKLLRRADGAVPGDQFGSWLEGQLQAE